jgi:GNAT superfamily N-acetyltransferase
MEHEILRLDSIPSPDRPERLEEARLIFEETAPPLTSLSPDAKKAFEHKYFGIYLETPGSFFLACDRKQVLGYLAGAPETLPLHFALNPYLEQFRAEIEDHFPAHLHLNLAAAARGAGLGSKLIDRYVRDLLRQQHGPSGVHVVTAKDAENVGFYLKNGFEKTRVSGKLLLMGRSLSVRSNG